MSKPRRAKRNVEQAAADVPSRADASEYLVNGRPFVGPDVARNPRRLTATRDVEKAAAEVPSHANASERASAGSNNSLTAVIESETSRTNSFLTTLCGNRDTDPARAVGGCLGMEVHVAGDTTNHLGKLG